MNDVHRIVSVAELVKLLHLFFYRLLIYPLLPVTLHSAVRYFLFRVFTGRSITL